MADGSKFKMGTSSKRAALRITCCTHCDVWWPKQLTVQRNSYLASNWSWKLAQIDSWHWQSFYSHCGFPKSHIITSTQEASACFAPTTFFILMLRFLFDAIYPVNAHVSNEMATACWIFMKDTKQTENNTAGSFYPGYRRQNGPNIWRQKEINLFV